MADDSIEYKKDAEGKNKEAVCCSFCPSKMLNPGSGTYINTERDEEVDKSEVISDYWKVENITNFENISVTRKVENIKYLACADCEIGPVGWYDLATLQAYVALPRVKHQSSNS
ncbi:hypothetical protein QAD02_009472 [Eretmocerus hayati]|uniref:Uncharacterized protein n=1 Tax=Eretmocerus hayati TaxID=131215 RepID=A0ACC2N9B3_9HYME|nr:hypothetical protein QAD02_009472 [Eretmocerus hayati]